MRTGFVLSARRKAVAILAGVGLCTLAVPTAVALANAANPCGTSLTNGVCPPSNGGGTGTETPVPGSTAVTVTVSGYWTWSDCTAGANGKCSGQQTTAATGPFGPGHGCMQGSSVGRVGVGWAMIWNDPTDPGYTIANGYAVGSQGNSLNPEDHTVHVQMQTPCGPTDGSGIVKVGNTSYPSGQWGPISHTYAKASDVPAIVCVNMYDPHGTSSFTNSSGALNKDWNATQNHDNSIQTNGFVPTNGSCFSPVGTGALTGHIYSCATGSQTTTEVPGGTITFSGHSALPNPVSLTVSPGGYNADAQAPTGYALVTCGSHDYTVGNGGGTASYTNQIQVTTSTPGQAIFYVAPLPTFSLSKSVLPSGPVAVGTPLAYTVTVKNNSLTLPGDPGVIKDTPSATTGLTYSLSGSPVPSIGTVTEVSTNPLELDWATGSIPANTSETLTLTLIPTAAGSSQTPALTNTAYNNNTNCPNPGMQGCTTVTPLTQFGLSKTVSPTGPQKVGTTLTYTVTVTNLTTTAGDPGTISDNLEPNGVTYTITSGPTPTQGTVNSVNPGTFNFLPGNLPGSGNASVTVKILITGITPGAANPSIANTAFDQVTNCPTPNVKECTPNTPVPDFLLKKTVTPSGPVTVGATLTYTVTETNVTPTAGDGGTVSDTITANGVQYSIVSGPTASQGTVTGTASPFSWAVGNIPGNGSAHITLVIKVTGVTPGTVNPTIINTAVNTNTNCATPNNPDCTTNTPLIVITLNKTVNKTTANLGDTLTYTVTVGNTGAAAATNVLVDDLFGGDAGFLVNDGTNGTVDSFVGSPVVTVSKIANGHYQWTLPIVNVGDHDVVTFTAIIQAPSGLVTTSNAGTVTLTNTVSIPTYTTGTSTYTNPGNNPPPVTVSTVAPFGGVQALTTPPTGAMSTVGITAAGFLLLGGLGLILLGVLAQTPTTARRRQS